MTVNVSKPAINVREKLAELDKPTGIAGEAMLRAETPQEQFQLIGAGRKNIVKNGAMQVAQRGTSSTSNGYQTVDRFKPTNATDGTFTQSQGTTNPPAGFSHYFRTNVDTADTSIGSTQYYIIQYAVEGYDAVPTGWGTSNAVPVTLSFWVRSNVTGTFVAEIQTASASSYESSHNYTIDNADTWEKKTITIPPFTVQALSSSTNAAGFYIMWWLAAGSTFNTGDISNEWTTPNAGRASGQVNVFNAANNYFDITGVQLELGKVATPFEHRSYGEELALCQRFFCIPVNNLDEDGNSNTMSAIGVGRGAAGGAVVVYALHSPVPMRDRPAITSSGSYYITDSTSRTTATPTAVTISQFSPNSTILLANYSFSSVVCDDDRVNMVGAATAVKITLDAEL